MSNFRRRLMGLSGGGGRLPGEYQAVEYIEGNGNQYIRTSIYSNPLIVCQIDFTGNSGGDLLMGAFTNYGEGSNGWLRLFSAGSSWYIDIVSDSGSRLVGGGFANNQRYNIEFGDRYIKLIDGEYIVSGPSVDFANRTTPIYFGKDLRKIYSGKIYDNAVLVSNFIPCYRKSDNKPGMYDLAGSICPLTNSPFYINSGSGEFTVGPDVN